MRSSVISGCELQHLDNTPEIDQLEAHLQCRLGGRVRNFRLTLRDEGLILFGHAPTYYAKQLAQQAVMEATDRPIVANQIVVS